MSSATTKGYKKKCAYQTKKDRETSRVQEFSSPSILVATTSASAFPLLFLTEPALLSGFWGVDSVVLAVETGLAALVLADFKDAAEHLVFFNAVEDDDDLGLTVVDDARSSGGDSIEEALFEAGLVVVAADFLALGFRLGLSGCASVSASCSSLRLEELEGLHSSLLLFEFAGKWKT